MKASRERLRVIHSRHDRFKKCWGFWIKLELCASTKDIIVIHQCYDDYVPRWQAQEWFREYYPKKFNEEFIRKYGVEVHAD